MQHNCTSKLTKRYRFKAKMAQIGKKMPKMALTGNLTLAWYMHKAYSVYITLIMHVQHALLMPFSQLTAESTIKTQKKPCVIVITQVCNALAHTASRTCVTIIPHHAYHHNACTECVIHVDSRP